MHDPAAANHKANRYLAAILWLLTCALGGYVVLFVLPILYRRLTFPGILQHQESMTIFLVHRITENLSNLYEMPSLHSESVIYNPAYYFYLWALGPLVGYQSAPIRIASVVPPLLLCAVLIEFVGRRYMRLPWLGLASAFVSLAVYPLFTWIDLARLEAMLLLSIELVWLALCINDNWRPKFILVGLAIAFSFAVKQPGALLVAAPLALVFTDRRYLISVVVAVVAIALFVTAMYMWFGDPYLRWVYVEPGSHPFSISEAAQYLREMVAVAPLILFSPLLAIALGIPSANPLQPASSLRPEKHRFVTSPVGKLLVVVAVTSLISVMGAGKLGGSVAQYVILLFLVTIPAAEMTLRGLRTTDWVSMRLSLVVLLMLGYSIAMIELRGHRSNITPRSWDRRQQAALLELVQSTPDETWVTPWPHVNIWAGRPATSTFAFIDQYPPAHEETQQAIRSRKFAFIVLPQEYQIPYHDLIKANYVHCLSLPMRHFQAQLFLPTEIWARSKEECRQARRALQQ